MSLRPRLDDLLELRHQAHTLGLASHHLVNSSFSGLYASVFRGQGLNFEEVREYREGDDIRNMDWKVTARTGEPHSATNQFFINTADNDFLDHKSKSMRGWGYTVFGEVISGWDVVTAIAEVETGYNELLDAEDVPLVPVKILSATVQ